MELKKELEDTFGIKIINLYGYGSYYYGTYKEGVSDRDFKVISDKVDHEELSNDKYNLHIVTYDEYVDYLNKHEIGFVESHQHPIYVEIDIPFVFSKEAIKHSVSAVADNAYVKAKKKLSKEAKDAKTEKEKRDNIYKAKKSLFHSMRVLDFGIQMCRNKGKIVNWTHMIWLYDEIMKLPEDVTSWPEWNSKYKKKYNELKTEFRVARHES